MNCSGIFNFLDQVLDFNPDKGEKTFSPSSPRAVSLLPLSPKRTQVLVTLHKPDRTRGLKITPVSCLAHARFIFRTHGGLRSKSAVCGLNGLRPASARGSPPFKSSTATRSCSCGLFPWVASLTPKKYGTPYFSVRNRPSKYYRSCSFVAELLR